LETYYDRDGVRQFRYVSYSNPGGRNGYSGLAGATPQTVLFDGAPGRTGACSYIVRHNDGRVVTYTSPYDLRIQSFKMHDENEDGIFEPGECVILKHFIIQNCGMLLLFSIKINHSRFPR
jgi:hypothetical protein